jgi:hypothetical protein
MASVLWGAYGRFVSEPKVGIFIIVACIATNVGLILGSKMWDVPLVDNVNQLWISPTSDVRADFNIEYEFASPVFGSNDELFMLGNADKSTMTTEKSIDAWYNLTEAVYDTVVWFNGTAFTMLDICNGREGQSAYAFGCDVFNPIDYFYEGSTFFPLAAAVQWLLEAKLAPCLLGSNSSTQEVASWAWAIEADLECSASSTCFNNFLYYQSPYTQWFLQKCGLTGKIFCGEAGTGLIPSAEALGYLVNQVNTLTANPYVPSYTKLELSWIKAQLVADAIVTTAAKNGGSCTGAPFDMETLSNTVTANISFNPTDDIGYDFGKLLTAADHYVNGQTYSMQNCASGSSASGSSCTPTCSQIALGSTAPYNFSSPCASCIMSVMYWMQELTNIAGITPSTSGPPAGPFVNPNFQVWSSTSGRSQGDALAIQAAEGVVGLGACATLTGEVPAPLCVDLWNQNYNATIAGLELIEYTVYEVDLMNEANAVITSSVTNRAEQLYGYGYRACTEMAAITATPYTFPYETQWIYLLEHNYVPSAAPTLFRWNSRPSYKTLSQTEIATTLSSDNNDLLSQNLRGIILGGTTPAIADVSASGACVCDATTAGLQCSLTYDPICDCASAATDLTPTCVGGLLGACGYLTSCAGYTTITTLVADYAVLGVPASFVGPYQNFTQEMILDAGLLNNSVKATTIYEEFCGNYQPCVDVRSISDPSVASMLPPSWAGVLSDLSYTFAFFADLEESPEAFTGGLLSFVERARLIATGCYAPVASAFASGSGLTTAETNCANGVNSFFETASGYTYLASDAQALLGCFSSGTWPTNCASTPMSGSSASDATATTACPNTFGYFKKLPGYAKVFTQAYYWMCFTENQQPFPYSATSNFGPRQSGAQAFWSTSGTNPLKTSLCAAATATIPESDCVYALIALEITTLQTGLAELSSTSPATKQAAVQTALLDVVFNGGSAPLITSNYGYQSAISSFLSSTLAKHPPVVATFSSEIFNSCTNYNNANCVVFRQVVDNVLAKACDSAQLSGLQTTITNSDCLTVVQNFGGAAFKVPASVLAISEVLFNYIFMGTLFGACGANGEGVTVPVTGGGPCTSSADCSYNGTCTGNANPFTSIDLFGGVMLTNTGPGTEYTMSRWESKYRAAANAPIFARYEAKHGTPSQGYGQTGPVKFSSAQQAHDLVKAWRVQYLANALDFGGNNTNFATTALSADSFTDLLNQVSGGSAGLLVLGYAMMLLYAFLSNTYWSCDKVTMLNGSRSLAAQLGVWLVAFSVAGGLGVSRLLHIQWSAGATQIIPFVMLGLGVSDVFIMLRTFPLYHEGVTAGEAAAKGLMTAGPSMLLVSVTNAGVFAVGILTQMPVVVNFAKQTVIIVISNYLTVNLAYPAILCLDYYRQKRGLMDSLPFVRVGNAVHATVVEGEYEKNVFNRACVPFYSSFILSVPGKIFVLSISFAFLVSAVYGEQVVAQLGLAESDLAPVTSELYQALTTRDANFASYLVSIDTAPADWSQIAVQQGIVSIFTQISATSKVIPGSGTPWMEAFAKWGMVSTPLYDAFTGGNPCDPNSPLTGGACGAVQNCTVVTNTAQAVTGTAPYYYPFPYYEPNDFYRCLQLWINSDLTYDALNPEFPLEDPTAPIGHRVLTQSFINGIQVLDYSTGSVFSRNLQYNNDFVVLIAETRAIANLQATPPCFPSGEPIEYWDQYATLDTLINHAVGYSLLLCWISIFVMLFGLAEGDGSGLGKRVLACLWASILATGLIALTVYEIYGYMAWAGIFISAIPAVNIIMSTGVAVEYTGYICVSFVNAMGTRDERARHALMVMMAPTIDGVATMFLGVVMLAGSPFPFIVKYFFYPWLFICFFGFFNGVALLPVMFSLVGPFSINVREGKTIMDNNELTVVDDSKKG